MKPIKMIFMGTPEFSVPILEMLIKKYNVIAVVTQPDKYVGRKKILTPSPIKSVAINNNIKALTPERIKKSYDEITKLNPDIIITCAYGQIIPTEILNCPKYGCINVHASLLPKYRGGAPIQRSIINGEVKTGITLMFMDEGLDTGDIIESEDVIIDNDDTYESLSKKLMSVGTELLEKVLPSILSGKNKRQNQDNNLATYAPIITRADELLDFNKKTLDIYNHIRGLSPNPGAYAVLNGKVVKIYNSRIGDHVYMKAQNGQIVKIYKDGIGVSTSDSEIIITDIKIEGHKRVLVKDYLNGKNSDDLIGKIFNER